MIMAPNREHLLLPIPKDKNNNIIVSQKPPKLSMDTLQRTISDISFELIAQEALNPETPKTTLATISEVEDAKCECCGMCEECTPQYVKKMRDKFGQMICGLCSEAVMMEMEKNGGKEEEALQAHVSACSRFNRVGRAFPVLCQAQAMKNVLRNSRGKSLSPRDKGGTTTTTNNPNRPTGIARSSSCIPALTKEIHQH